MRLKIDPNLSREERVALGFVSLCGFSVFILGGFYLWHHVTAPFSLLYEGEKVLDSAARADAQKTALMQADTDSDGLSDYDEMNIFNTSPYLDDSDGDKISDGNEIKVGTDPNCASGDSECLKTTPDEVVKTPIPSIINTPAPQSPEDPLTAASTLTPGQIRTLLVESGLNADDVAKLTDDEVVALHAAAIQQIMANQSSTP